MEVTNDNSCSWVQDLIPRTNIKTLQTNEDCEWLVIGAGYTGLSAARKLGQLYPNQKIILVDAQLAGEGASSRNSGYLVDTTLNDGFTSNKDLENYFKKHNRDLNSAIFNGGEEYEFVFTIPSKYRKTIIKNSILLKTPIIEIGYVASGKGVYVQNNNEEFKLKDLGWKHFK